MICSLRGVLSARAFDQITIDVNGVGYSVFVPLKTFSKLPNVGDNIFLHVQTIFNDEGGIFLYGFIDESEREVFNFLRQAKGVGVRTAFTLLSFFDAHELVNYIESQNVTAFTNVPGIGKKTAERIIFELKDKVKKLTFTPQGKKPIIANEDAQQALISLGYSFKDAKEAVHKAMGKLSEDASVEVILKEALKFLMKR